MTLRPDSHSKALSRRNLLLTSSALAAAVALPSDVTRAQDTSATVDPTHDEVLQSIIRSIEAIPVGPFPTGATINNIWRQGQITELGTKYTIEDLRLAYLYSGLAVLAKGTFDYLQDNPRDDAEQFLNFVKEVNNNENQNSETNLSPITRDFRSLSYLIPLKELKKEDMQTSQNLVGQILASQKSYTNGHSNLG